MIINVTEIYKRNSFLKQISSCNSLEDLKSLLEGDKNLEITQFACNTVFADGNKNAQCMIIGEAPGREEDEKGIPFCGKAGKYLDKMFGLIDLNRREDVYITNVVNWRPENNRIPTEQEIRYCLPYLEKHIALQNPRLIVTLGSTAAFALLTRSAKPQDVLMKDIILKTYKYKNFFSKKEISIFPMYHPSYMMRNHNMQDLFKLHFKKLSECISALVV